MLNDKNIAITLKPMNGKKKKLTGKDAIKFMLAHEEFRNMTGQELTSCWLNGRHEYAIAHGLTKNIFEANLGSLEFDKSKAKGLVGELEAELKEIYS